MEILPTSASPTTTIEVGANAEDRATAYLIDRGYTIVERNFEIKAGELDIIARDGAILVFVEVRSRANADHGHAVEMITPAKQRQVARIAGFYLQLRRPAYDEIRFDVVAITGDEILLVQDAWRL
ncbi:MAG TPA: YraN family protein [Kofleriaceae bacterium]|nr:YraN family protein [Kofleriaceae bacterium]